MHLPSGQGSFTNAIQVGRLHPLLFQVFQTPASRMINVNQMVRTIFSAFTKTTSLLRMPSLPRYIVIITAKIGPVSQTVYLHISSGWSPAQWIVTLLRHFKSSNIHIHHRSGSAYIRVPSARHDRSIFTAWSAHWVTQHLEANHNYHQQLTVCTDC